MDVQVLSYIFVGGSFLLYFAIAVWSRAGSTKDFYVAGGGVPPVVNGMATAADWMSAASFLSVAGLLAALIITIGYSDGPYRFPTRPFSWGLVGSVVRGRPWRLATGGYLGHMWELYAFWAWISAFLAASERLRLGLPADSAVDATTRLAAFAAIAAGGAGCIWGGRVADRIGYEPLTIRALAVSGSCALVVGLFFGRTNCVSYRPGSSHACII